jgi:hypothetical protein
MPVFLANYLFINYKIFTTHAPECSIRIGKIPLDLLPQQFHNGCRLMNYLATMPPALARPWSSPTISILSQQRTWPPPPRPLSTHLIWRCSTIDCKVVVRMNPHGEQDIEEYDFLAVLMATNRADTLAWTSILWHLQSSSILSRLPWMRQDMLDHPLLKALLVGFTTLLGTSTL